MRIKFFIKRFVNFMLDGLDLSKFSIPMNDVDHLQLTEKAIAIFKRYPNLASSYLTQHHVDILLRCRPSKLHKLDVMFAQHGYQAGIEALQWALPTISEQIVQEYVHDDESIMWSTEWFRVLNTMQEFRAVVVQTKEHRYIPLVQHMGFCETGGYHVVFSNPSTSLFVAIQESQLLALEFVREQHGMDHDPRVIPKTPALELVSRH